MGFFINFYRRRTIVTHRDTPTDGRVYREFMTKRSRKCYLSRPKLRRILDPQQIIPVDEVELGSKKPIRHYENTMDSPEEFLSELIYLEDMPTFVRTMALRRIHSTTVEPGFRTASGFPPHQTTEPNHGRQSQSQSQHLHPTEAIRTSPETLATIPQSQFQLNRETNEQDISYRNPDPALRRPLSSATSFRHPSPYPHVPITLPRSNVIDLQSVTEEQEVDKEQSFDIQEWLV